MTAWLTRPDLVKHFQDEPQPAVLHQDAGRSPPLGVTGKLCLQHVQAFTVAIDQYAEKALGNRDYLLSRPHSIGGGRNDHMP